MILVCKPPKDIEGRDKIYLDFDYIGVQCWVFIDLTKLSEGSGGSGQDDILIFLGLEIELRFNKISNMSICFCNWADVKVIFEDLTWRELLISTNLAAKIRLLYVRVSLEIMHLRFSLQFHFCNKRLISVALVCKWKCRYEWRCVARESDTNVCRFTHIVSWFSGLMAFQMIREQFVWLWNFTIRIARHNIWILDTIRLHEIVIIRLNLCQRLSEMCSGTLPRWMNLMVSDVRQDNDN